MLGLPSLSPFNKLADGKEIPFKGGCSLENWYLFSMTVQKLLFKTEAALEKICAHSHYPAICD